MVDYAAHVQKIHDVEAELRLCENPKRKHDLKKYLGRLHKELSEAKKWQRGEIGAKQTESDSGGASVNR